MLYLPDTGVTLTNLIIPKDLKIIPNHYPLHSQPSQTKLIKARKEIQHNSPQNLISAYSLTPTSRPVRSAAAPRQRESDRRPTTHSLRSAAARKQVIPAVALIRRENRRQVVPGRAGPAVKTKPARILARGGVAGRLPPAASGYARRAASAGP